MPRAISKDALREGFASIVDDLGRIPSADEYETRTEFSTLTLTTKFAPGEDNYSYYDAVRALGYQPSQSKSGLSPSDITQDWLAQDFDRVVDELGHVPSRDEYATHGSYEPTVFVGLLSDSFKYTDAVTTLGYTPRDTTSRGRDPIPDADVRADFEHVVDELGRVPRRPEYDEHGEYSASTFAAKFSDAGSNSYIEAVKGLGYEPADRKARRDSTSSEAVAEDFARVVDQLGHIPNSPEYAQTADYASTTLTRHFGDGGYWAAVEALGYVGQWPPASLDEVHVPRHVSLHDADRAILADLVEQETGSPEGIADRIDYSEGVIQQRCARLEAYDVLRTREQNTYQIHEQVSGPALDTDGSA